MICARIYVSMYVCIYIRIYIRVCVYVCVCTYVGGPLLRCKNKVPREFIFYFFAKMYMRNRWVD